MDVKCKAHYNNSETKRMDLLPSPKSLPRSEAVFIFRIDIEVLNRWLNMILWPDEPGPDPTGPGLSREGLFMFLSPWLPWETIHTSTSNTPHPHPSTALITGPRPIEVWCLRPHGVQGRRVWSHRPRAALQTKAEEGWRRGGGAWGCCHTSYSRRIGSSAEDLTIGLLTSDGRLRFWDEIYLAIEITLLLITSVSCVLH